MKIWLINNYTMLPEHGPMTRQYYFAKELSARGHEVTVFAGSHIHNSDIQLVEGERWKIWQEQPFRWVYVHTLAYGKSRKKQVLSMFQFYRNTAIAAQYFRKQYGTPDVILGSSAHPLTALLAVRLGQKYHCKSIAEIRDLWPESIVAMGVAGARNPAVLALRRLEKWIYKKADALVFTMEGAYDYILEQGWDKDIPRSKVHYINNGVNLEQFDYNKEHYPIDDPALNDPSTFKVVYAGSIRLANGVDAILDCAMCLKDEPDIRFLIYGSGGDTEALLARKEACGLDNVLFQGRVDKKYIPYVLSKSDLNLLNYFSAAAAAGLYRFGSSQNKIFDYFASGRPVVENTRTSYDLVEKYGCGVCEQIEDGAHYAAVIRRMKELPREEYLRYCQNARRAAEDYDFKRLTDKLMAVIDGISKK